MQPVEPVALLIPGGRHQGAGRCVGLYPAHPVPAALCFEASDLACCRPWEKLSPCMTSRCKNTRNTQLEGKSSVSVWGENDTVFNWHLCP